jgi:hypothetical protein
MEAKSLRLGWGQAWRRQGGLGAHPLLFLFPTHYLKRKKKKSKRAHKLFKKPDITSGRPRVRQQKQKLRATLSSEIILKPPKGVL